MKRTEHENNELVAKIFIGLAAFIVAIWIFCLAGMFDFDMKVATFFAGVSLIALIVPVILIYVFHINNDYMKYILISIVSLLIGLCYCIYTFQMIIMFLIPALVAMLYMDKRLLYFSGVVNLIVIIGAHIITVFYVLQPWLEPFMGMQDIIRFDVIPRVMQLSICFWILVVVMNRMVSYMDQIKNINAMRISDTEAEKKIADIEKQEYDSCLEKLTDREIAVFIQMLLGKTNVQIADALCLSIGTVKNYVSTIYDKIGTRERNYLILKYGRLAVDYDQSNK